MRKPFLWSLVSRGKDRGYRQCCRGGKSTLARDLANRRGLRLVEVDQLLWQKGWKLTPEEIYVRRHAEIIGQDDWVIEGLGRQNSIAGRLARATEIVLIDLPLWVHFWLAAERQSLGRITVSMIPPAGSAEMPLTGELFRTIWEVDKAWLPGLRIMCQEAEGEGKAGDPPGQPRGHRRFRRNLTALAECRLR